MNCKKSNCINKKVINRIPKGSLYKLRLNVKLRRVHLSSRVNNRASAPFELVHSDVWGPCPVVSPTGFPLLRGTTMLNKRFHFSY